MEKKLGLVSALSRWCCLGTRVTCSSVVHSQLFHGSGTEQGEYHCISKCCQQQFCCRLLGMPYTSTIYPRPYTWQFYASLKKHFKGKHLCHQKWGESQGALMGADTEPCFLSMEIKCWCMSWIIKKYEMDGARMGDERGAYRVLVGRPELKRPFGRPRHKWGQH